MIWTTNKKERIPLSEMSTEHINKCVSMLKMDVKRCMLNIVKSTDRCGYVRDLANTESYSKVGQMVVQITLAKSYLRVFKRELKKRRKQEEGII